MKTARVDIFGDYVDSDAQRWTEEDVSPAAFRRAVEGLEKGDALDVHLNSCGGSVVAGIAIANEIRALSAKGVRTVCTVDGLAASIASITAMACDELRMFPQSFVMVHNPWTFAQGDADALRKEAGTLDAMKAALVSFYRRKFDRTDDEIRAMMDAETWISGADAAASGLAVTLVEDGGARAAARLALDSAKRRFNIFAMVEAIKAKGERMEENDPKRTEEPETTEDPKPAEETAPEKTEEPEKTREELEAENAALRAKVAELETARDQSADERVAKCQSVFQKKINDLENERQATAKELQSAQASASSLAAELEAFRAELAKAQAAAQEKTDALAKLNAAVLAHAEEVPTLSEGLKKCRTPEEKSRFIASGKYVRD